MTTAANGYCPSCRSGRIRKRYKTPWECRGCGHRFVKPVAMGLPPVIGRVCGVASSQRALDRYTAQDPFWGSDEGQRILEFAALMNLRPIESDAGWCVRFVIRPQAPSLIKIEYPPEHIGVVTQEQIINVRLKG